MNIFIEIFASNNVAKSILNFRILNSIMATLYKYEHNINLIKYRHFDGPGILVYIYNICSIYVYKKCIHFLFICMVLFRI